MYPTYTGLPFPSISGAIPWNNQHPSLHLSFRVYSVPRFPRCVTVKLSMSVLKLRGWR